MVRNAGPWEGDVNEAAIEDWKEETTTFERVQQVIDVTTEPESAGELADRAHVSEPTARKYLDAMVESGRVKAINTDSGTRYLRSPQMVAMHRIALIHREHTKDEIHESIQRFQREISELQDKHDVPTVDNLVLDLDGEDDSWQDVARWKQLKENLKIAEAALSLYDFDPDDNHRVGARAADGSDGSDRRQRGVFGYEDEYSVA